MLPYGPSKALVIGGFGKSDSPYLKHFNEILETSCDLNGKCTPWSVKTTFPEGRQGHVALWTSLPQG